MLELDTLRKLIAAGYPAENLPASYQAQLQSAGGQVPGAQTSDFQPAGSAPLSAAVHDFLTPEQEAALSRVGLGTQNIGMLDRGDLTLADWLSLVGARPGGPASTATRMGKLEQLTPAERAGIEGALGPSMAFNPMPSLPPGFDPFQGSLLTGGQIPEGMLNIQPYIDIMAQWRPDQYGMLSSQAAPMPAPQAPQLPAPMMQNPGAMQPPMGDMGQFQNRGRRFNRRGRRGRMRQ